jgi:Mrp family chromosome partitioning ATPase
VAERDLCHAGPVEVEELREERPAEVEVDERDPLAGARERADIVLVDAPPALNVGDAMTLSAKVDGIIVVTRMKIVRRQMLGELARQLATVPTPVLGFVVTDAAGEDEGYGYGYGYGGYAAHPYEQSAKAKAAERV